MPSGGVGTMRCATGTCNRDATSCCAVPWSTQNLPVGCRRGERERGKLLHALLPGMVVIESERFRIRPASLSGAGLGDLGCCTGNASFTITSFASMSDTLEYPSEPDSLSLACASPRRRYSSKMIVTAFNSAVYNASFIHAAIDGFAKLENTAMKKNARLPAIASRRYAKMLGAKLWEDWCCVLEHAMATFMSTLHGHLAHMLPHRQHLTNTPTDVQPCTHRNDKQLTQKVCLQYGFFVDMCILGGTTIAQKGCNTHTYSHTHTHAHTRIHTHIHMFDI